MARRKRRTYTEEQRQAVLATVRSRGVIAASKEHGVPQSCVSRWAAAAEVKRGQSAPMRAQSRQAVATAADAARQKRRAAKSYTPSQRAEALEYASAHGVAAAAVKFGISRFSIYGWQKKVEKAAKGDGTSPTSGPAPKDIEAQRDKEILDEWHKHPGLAPSQIVAV